MSYALLCLVFVLPLGSMAWFVSFKATPADLLPAQTVKVLWGTWIALTSVAFLSGHGMVFLAASAIILSWVRKRAPALVIYAVFLTTLPNMIFPVSGFGPINNLIDLSYQRLLVWLVLLPALMQARQDKDYKPLGHHAADWLGIAYGILIFALQLRLDTLTNSLRVLLYYFSDNFWVYFAFSRLIKTREDFRRILWSLAIGIAATTLVAMYEQKSRWMLYDIVDKGLGLRGSFSYLIRSGTGLLRAYGSSGHPLILGLITTLGLIWAAGCRQTFQSPQQRKWAVVLLLCLLGALFASQARGMWVGAVIGWLIWVVTGRDAIKQLALLGLAGGAALGVAMSTDMGKSIIDTLPFIGSSDQDNVTYRQQLFDVSLLVIKENFFFGTFNFFDHPLMQSLVQGQGIVDPVNVFIIYALNSGMVGFSLFAGAWLAALWGVFRRSRQPTVQGTDLGVLGRAHLAALIAMVVMIVTTSLVGTIPMMIWVCIGLSMAYCDLVDTQTKASLVDRRRQNANKAQSTTRPSKSFAR
jgi:O-Antigen ligase